MEIVLKLHFKNVGEHLTENPSAQFHSYTWVNTLTRNQAGTLTFLAFLRGNEESSILHSKQASHFTEFLTPNIAIISRHFILPYALNSLVLI